MAAAARNSHAKSRSLTASIEFSLTLEKPNNRATSARSSVMVDPAMAPLPSGSTSSRRAASSNRPSSRANIST